MKVLLDEHFVSSVARALNEFSSLLQLEWEALEDLKRGLLDEELPEFCRARGFDALGTLNVRDFGARLHLYEALLDAGVSVIVVRPGKLKLKPPGQLSILSMHGEELAKKLADRGEDSILLRVSPSEIRSRSLEELREEIEGRTRLP